MHNRINELIEELKEENESLKLSASPQDEMEALKEVLEVLMGGAREVQEQIDRFNDRRYRQ